MKKIDIYTYRGSDIEQNHMVLFNDNDIDTISGVLRDKRLVSKRAGLCAGPWNMYFATSRQDSRGVSHNDSYTKNVFYITVNEATSTMSRRNYFYSLRIVKTNDFFYLTALSQSKARYKNINTLDSCVYEFTLDELQSIINIVFEDVESVTTN